jgi:hypothetical protein
MWRSRWNIISPWLATYRVSVRTTCHTHGFFFQEVDLQATVVWSLGSNSHIYLTNYRYTIHYKLNYSYTFTLMVCFFFPNRLISLRIRKPGMVIASEAHQIDRNKFVIEYCAFHAF